MTIEPPVGTAGRVSAQSRARAEATRNLHAKATQDSGKPSPVRQPFFAAVFGQERNDAVDDRSRAAGARAPRRGPGIARPSARRVRAGAGTSRHGGPKGLLRGSALLPRARGAPRSHRPASSIRRARSRSGGAAPLRSAPRPPSRSPRVRDTVLRRSKRRALDHRHDDAHPADCPTRLSQFTTKRPGSASKRRGDDGALRLALTRRAGRRRRLDSLRDAAGVRETLAQHRRDGNPVAVWRDGRVVWIPANEIPPELATLLPEREGAHRFACAVFGLQPDNLSTGSDQAEQSNCTWSDSALGVSIDRRLAPVLHQPTRATPPRWPSGRGTTASQKNGRPACASRPKVCVSALVRGD